MARNALIASLERRARKKSIGPKLFFEEKIENSPFKKQLRSDRNSSRAIFERGEEERVTIAQNSVYLRSTT